MADKYGYKSIPEGTILAPSFHSITNSEPAAPRVAAPSGNAITGREEAKPSNAIAGRESILPGETRHYDATGMLLNTPYQGKTIPAGGPGGIGPINMGVAGGAASEEKPVAAARIPINLSVYQGWGQMPDSKKSILLAELLKEDPAGKTFIAQEANKVMGEFGGFRNAGPGVDVASVGQDRYIAKRMGEKRQDITRALNSGIGAAEKKKLRGELAALDSFGVG